MAKKELIIGAYNNLKVTDWRGGRFFLDSSRGEIPLICDTRGADIQIGETLEVFAFTETNGSPIATLSTPYALVNEFACMTVLDSDKFGAYLDWGIEKDLFVFRKEQKRPMKVGKKYVVFVKTERLKGKIQGTTFLEERFDPDTDVLKQWQEVSLLIYDITEIGIMAVVEGRYSGMLYINECFEKVKIGDIKRGYIKKIRTDGKLDLTLQPHIKTAIHDSKDIVLSKLEENGGFLPFHDKSNPETIKKAFHMSKKNFKKAIGGLYREKKIYITDNGIYSIANKK